MEESYVTALKLVEQIDRGLRLGLKHYRTRAGELLTTLDEVVRAILDDNLLLEEQRQPVPVPVERSEEERWPQLSW